jgi:hypothetical protein
MSKKKVSGARVTVIDNPPSAFSPGLRDFHKQQADDYSAGFDPDVFVLRAVKNDPFVTISEIRGESALELDKKLGWWQVFGILRKNRLLRRKSRFRYAWGRP